MELNRERIIQGLVCCKGSYDCFTCDIYKRGCSGFRTGMAKDALALINELTEENERLQKALNTDISIVRVSRGSGKTNHLREVARVRMDAVRADTVRKMVERLKAQRWSDASPHDYDLLHYVIDRVAEDILEGTDEKS